MIIKRYVVKIGNTFIQIHEKRERSKTNLKIEYVGKKRGDFFIFDDGTKIRITKKLRQLLETM